MRGLQGILNLLGSTSGLSQAWESLGPVPQLWGLRDAEAHGGGGEEAHSFPGKRPKETHFQLAPVELGEPVILSPAVKRPPNTTGALQPFSNLSPCEDITLVLGLDSRSYSSFPPPREVEV